MKNIIPHEIILEDAADEAIDNFLRDKLKKAIEKATEKRSKELLEFVGFWRFLPNFLIRKIFSREYSFENGVDIDVFKNKITGKTLTIVTEYGLTNDLGK